MRLTAVFILAVSIHVSARGYSQERVNLKLHDVSMETALKAISKQSGYRLFCDPSLIDPIRHLDVSLSNATLVEALDYTLKGQPLSYTITDGYFVINKKSASAALEDAVPPGAPTRTLRGLITDSHNVPMEGASIQVLGTNLGTSTSANGTFELRNVPVNATLVVSYTGYAKKQIKVPEKGEINLTLSPATNELDQVVMQAYGTTSHRYSTGDISTVSGQDIASQPVSNVLEALEGRVPGLVVTQSTGIPGSSVTVQIRGQNTISGFNNATQVPDQPLFIIDGVPYAQGNSPINQLSTVLNQGMSASVMTANSSGLSPFSLINPADIASIEILKDADATAIYGSRGANGVVLITTKRGNPGKTKFNLNVYSGASTFTRATPFMNTQQYLKLREAAIANAGATPSLDPSSLGYAPDILLFDTTRNTNFTKEFLGGTDRTTDVQGSISGGSSTTTFLLGAGYHNEGSLFPGSMSDNKGSVHVNMSHTSVDRKFQTTFDAAYTYDQNNLIQGNFGGFLNLPPDFPAFFDSTGNLVWNYKGVELPNPYSYMYATATDKTDNLISDITLSYEIIPGLSFKANLGYTLTLVNEENLNPSKSIDPTLGVANSATYASSNIRSWIIEPQINYHRKINKHTIDLLAGSTNQDNSVSGNSQSGSNYSSDALLGYIGAAGTTGIPKNFYSLDRYASAFGRITYNYDNKYIVNLNARRDGSSRFGPDRQYGNFGSVGAAWIFTNEEVVKNWSALSFGKIRGSYGTTGNDNVGDYEYLNSYGSYYTYQGIGSLTPSSLYNPNYGWQINKKLEGAIDLGFIKDRILFSAAYYNNRCGNQLVQYNLPAQAGFTSVVANFPGVVVNEGWEFVLSTTNIKTREFSWSSSLNLSVPHNKLVSFPNISTSSYNTLVIGQPLSVYHGYKSLGVDPKAGDYVFADSTGKPTSNPSTTNGYFPNLGNTDPKFYGGFKNTFNYSGFQLDVFIDFKKQMGLNYLYQMAGYMPGTYNINGANYPTLAANYWTTPGQHAQLAQPNVDPNSAAYQSAQVFSGFPNSAMYSDASFIRLKNVALSYNVPQSRLRSFHIQGFKIFVQAQNLFTLTHYKGSDPETQNIFTLPPLRTVTGGINLTL